MSRAYRSPKNVRRALRKKTEYIILHTTEGEAKGSLAKVSKNGECHYLIDEKGVIYLIVDRARIAKHAGLSMWNGRTNLDTCSIGIEIVGWHDRDCTPAQYTALKKLVTELKQTYRVPDDRVLTHSMVAYGKPNFWQKKNHRGRKRCAMLFAIPSVRTKIGLSKKPTSDPDVKAGRLRIGDKELDEILYKATSVPVLPAKTAKAPAKPAENPAAKAPAKGAEKPAAKAPAKGAEKPASKASAKPAEKSVANEGDIFYFPKGKAYVVGSTLSKREAEALAKAGPVLRGYRVAGTVRVGKPVFSLVGTAWNKSTTYYWTKETGLVAGNKVSDKAIPKNAVVFVPK